MCLCNHRPVMMNIQWLCASSVGSNIIGHSVEASQWLNTVCVCYLVKQVCIVLLLLCVQWQVFVVSLSTVPVCVHCSSVMLLPFELTARCLTPTLGITLSDAECVCIFSGLLRFSKSQVPTDRNWHPDVCVLGSFWYVTLLKCVLSHAELDAFHRAGL